jgi:hypothetical protein
MVQDREAVTTANMDIIRQTMDVKISMSVLVIHCLVKEDNTV